MGSSSSETVFSVACNSDSEITTGNTLLIDIRGGGGGFFTLTDRASIIPSNMRGVANPVRGMLDRNNAEAVVLTQKRHRLDADGFSIGWTWQGFCRDLDPYLFE